MRACARANLKSLSRFCVQAPRLFSSFLPVLFSYPYPPGTFPFLFFLPLPARNKGIASAPCASLRCGCFSFRSIFCMPPSIEFTRDHRCVSDIQPLMKPRFSALEGAQPRMKNPTYLTPDSAKSRQKFPVREIFKTGRVRGRRGKCFYGGRGFFPVRPTAHRQHVHLSAQLSARENSRRDTTRSL